MKTFSTGEPPSTSVQGRYLLITHLMFRFFFILAFRQSLGQYEPHEQH